MNTIKRLTASLVLAAGLTVLTNPAGAATALGIFENEFAANYIFLFADNPGGSTRMQFNNITLTHGFADWDVADFDSELAVFNGAAVPGGAGRFSLGFEFRGRQVSFQWAEVFFDAVTPVVLGAGTADFRNGRGWSGSPVFSDPNRQFITDYFATVSAASVPLPNTVVLLLSAVTWLGLSRRNKAASVAVPA